MLTKFVEEQTTPDELSVRVLDLLARMRPVQELVGALIPAREPPASFAHGALLGILVRPALRDADDAAAHRRASLLSHATRVATRHAA